MRGGNKKKKKKNHKAAEVVQKTKYSKCILTHNDPLKTLLKWAEKNNLQVQEQPKEQNSLHNVSAQTYATKEMTEEEKKKKKCFRY